MDQQHKKLEEQNLQLGDSLARYASENSSLRRREKKYLKKTIRLENAIRLHATKQCSCANPEECLAKMYRIVPLKPRTTKKVVPKNV